MNLTSQYTSAIVSLVQEENKIDKVLTDAKLVRDSIASEDLQQLISSYNLTQDNKDNIIDKIYGDLDLTVVNSIKIMVEKRHSKFIFGVFKKVVTELNKLKGICEGYIYTTDTLSEANIKIIEDKIKKILNKDISLTCLIDKELLSGIKVEVDGHVFDYSAKGRLNVIKTELLKEDN